MSRVPAVDTGNKMVVPVTTDANAKPWEMVAMEVFELIFPKLRKTCRFLLGVDLATHLMFITATHQADISFRGTDSGEVLRDAFINNYLQHRPRPKWALSIRRRCAKASLWIFATASASEFW